MLFRSRNTHTAGQVQTKCEVHIRRLREKVEQDPAHPAHLCTKWGVGYYFKEA